MKPINNLNTTTPLDLLNVGKTWLSIWESKKDENLFIAIYCLFTAFEFYLKAYLVFKNNVYKDTRKLKLDIGHNFGNLFEKIIISKKNKFTDEIKTQINKYELRTINMDRLKYPEDGKMWSLERGFEKGEHTLENIFKTIDNEITINSDQWLIRTYPKKTEVSAITYIGYKGKLKEIDLGKLSNTCSDCLPPKITVFEEYNYPWHKELIPPRTCMLCKNLFDPKGMRPAIFN